jgi:uncharacterized protein YndB with AHSA1/START domain
MTRIANAQATAQVYRVYIKASPQAIWDAITDPEWNRRYGFGTPVEFDLRPGGAYRATANEEMQRMGVPEVIFEGKVEVVDANAPRKLVFTQAASWEPDERPSRVAYEIDEGRNGVSVLTVIHELEGAPKQAAMVAGQVENGGGGWPEALSDLKTLIETGRGLYL